MKKIAIYTTGVLVAAAVAWKLNKVRKNRKSTKVEDLQRKAESL